MLAYFAFGKRQYFDKPVPVSERPFWEFQAVIRGSIGRMTPDELDPNLKSSTLWISHPESQHGWIGARGSDAIVAVFHFRYIPESLSVRLQDAEKVEVPLTRHDIHQLHRLASRVQAYWTDPAPGMLLCYEYALLQLSMLAFEDLIQPALGKQGGRSEDRVQKALAWYNQNMHRNPGLPEIARHAHSSPANLRRLFHETLQASPKQMFDQLRYQRAMQLLTETGKPLAEIAEQCGFQDQSAFSRAFKHHFQCSPRDIRSPSTHHKD
jgi:AraC-like DNA-binding protein